MLVFRQRWLQTAGQGTNGMRQWHSLAGFVSTDADAHAWHNIRARETHCEGYIKKYNPKQTPTINWKQWEETIQHRELLTSLKDFHMHQTTQLTALQQENHDGAIGEQTEGWDIYQEAVKSCESSMGRSEALLADGARALWLSSRNPRAWTVDPNEWLESDEYWQAYIEKHHHYDPSKDYHDLNSKENFEDEATVEASKKEWRHTMDHCHDPVFGTYMYTLMDQMHSWAYYYLHKRAFIQHMIYFLLRTGSPPRLMPEIPPNEWLIDIAKLKYRYFSVAQKATLKEKIENVAADEEIGSCIQQSVKSEMTTYKLIAARLMANYMLFSYPYIALQTSRAMLAAVNQRPDGKFFDLGNDVNALFYLAPEAELPSAKDAIVSLLDYVRLTGRRFDTVYTVLLEMYAETIQERGKYWLKADDEDIASSFLRRLPTDDPLRAVYSDYVDEMTSRFAAKQELSMDQAMERIKEIEPSFEEECRLQTYIHECYVPLGHAQEVAENIASGKYKQMLADKVLFCDEESDANTVATVVHESVQQVEQLRDYIEKKVKYI